MENGKLYAKDLENSAWKSISLESKRRVNYSDGSYADITRNADGSETTITYKPCVICHSRRVCNLCGGAGGRWSGFGNYQNYNICRSCGGDGKCKYCYGTGMTVFTSTYYPGSNSTIGKDLWSGRTYSAGGGAGDKRESVSESNGTNNSATCSKCKGTGYDPFPSSSHGVGGWIGVYHNGHSQCNICGKWEEHWHDKCPSCNVPAY